MSAEDERDPAKSIIGTKVDAAELFQLLESHDSRIADEVKSLIYENLNSSKESWLLNAMVEYYMDTQSSRCIEILTGIREPHDKHLFDKLMELMKPDKPWRQKALILLGHIVRCQPSWLHRIASHRLMNTLLQLLKTDMDTFNLMSAMLIIVTLLPMIPSLFGPYLQDIFEVFSRIASWKTKKPVKVADVHLLHLHVVLYSLFHSLYALYPCNFLAYLRSFYGSRDHSRENLLVFTDAIKPMLERVRLHPLLVTASKETELVSARWKNMETHDVIVQCAKVCLDAIEGTQEEHQNTSTCTSMWKEISSASHAIHSPVIRQTSTYGEHAPIPIEPGSIMHETLQQLSSSVTAACPLFISDLSPTTAFQDMDQEDKEEEEVTNLLTTPTSHVVKAGSRSTSETREIEAAERKRQEEGRRVESSVQKAIPEKPVTTAVHASTHATKIMPVDVVQAEEATEDGAPQKVSEAPIELPKVVSITTVKDPSSCTNFLSTTDNLTAALSACTSPTQQGSGEDAKEQDEDLPKDDGRTSHVLIQRLVHGMNRLRFFSHCGHPPDIPIEWMRRSPALTKSFSCPEFLSVQEDCSEDKEEQLTSASVDHGKPADPAPCEATKAVESKNLPPQEVTEFPLQVPVVWPASSPTPQPPLQQPPAAAPVRTAMTSSAVLPANEPKLFSCLSPAEILDRHMQLGSDIYLKELSSGLQTSTKDINLTHSGGSAPTEETSILRGQISLMHNQLQFERYRRGVHAERNRRLLGNAKRARALEEQNMAMKDQLLLQEKEINEMTRKLNELNKKLHEVKIAKPDQDLHDHLRLLMEDNRRLDVDRKEMEYIIGSQKKDINKFIKQLDETQARLFEINLEFKTVKKEADRCANLEEQLRIKTKKLTVLYEVHGRYKDKMENLPKSRDFEFEMGLLENTAKHEIEELKRIVKSNTLQLDCYKSKVENLEKLLVSKDLIITELKQLIERIKSLNAEELESRESLLRAHKKIIMRQEEHIMEQNHKICILGGANASKNIPVLPGNRDYSDLLTPPLHPIPKEPLEKYCHTDDPSVGEAAAAGASSSIVDMEDHRASWGASSELKPAGK